jgi:hypothetical protein
MSLDKAIDSGKERRQQYRGTKAIDRTCRNHGSCPWCAEGRQHREKRQKKTVEIDDTIVDNVDRSW